MTTVPETTSHVPFLDLGLAHADLRTEVLESIVQVIDSSAFVNGAPVREFEERWAAWCAVEHCVGLASGLDALRLGLAALGIGPGDEVIVPAMTFVATWEAVSQVGATPVPVDVSEQDYCLDVEAVADQIGPRTRAILPVHLYGQMAAVTEVLALAERYDLVVLEDAAQAHGADRDSVRAGAAGHAAAFSFYPGKNLGAFGDAGALVTRDAGLARRVRALREHGQERKYHHDEIGWTARLDTIQAAVLLHKLERLEAWNDDRRACAARYDAALGGVGDLVLPPVAPGSTPVWHLYVVRTSDPDGLARFLSERGVVCGRHYPEPPHLSGAYASLGYSEGAFPVAEAIGRQCLSLPLFPGMCERQTELVAEGLKAWFVGA